MVEFFEGWKRKVGFVTLVMACALSLGWVRSLYVTDLIVPNLWTANSSSNGSLIHARYFFSSLTPALPLWDIHRTSEIRDYSDLFSKWILPDRVDWRFRACGFGICDIADDQGLWVRLMIIPYWSIVIPLTALSAWLLLSKPRSAKPVEKTTDTSPVKGGTIH